VTMIDAAVGVMTTDAVVEVTMTAEEVAMIGGAVVEVMTVDGMTMVAAVEEMTMVAAVEEMTMVAAVEEMTTVAAVEEMMTEMVEATVVEATVVEATVVEETEGAMMMVPDLEIGTGSMFLSRQLGSLPRNWLLSSQHCEQRQRCQFSEMRALTHLISQRLPASRAAVA
ncbi:unnamed protein product, partial [Symbiodinium necroappetens]